MLSRKSVAFHRGPNLCTTKLQRFVAGIYKGVPSALYIWPSIQSAAEANLSARLSVRALSRVVAWWCFTAVVANSHPQTYLYDDKDLSIATVLDQEGTRLAYSLQSILACCEGARVVSRVCCLLPLLCAQRPNSGGARGKYNHPLS